MQEHIFIRCQNQSTRSDSQNKDYDDIFKVIDKQKETVEHFLKIEAKRKKVTKEGGG